MMNRGNSSEQHEGQVLSFIGTTPNIGTTVCALATAYRIVEVTECKVAFLCMNFKSSKLHRYMNIPPSQATVDELLPHLRTHSLTPTMLMNAMTISSSRPQLHLLLGNRYREMAEYFSDEDIGQLVATAKEHYDYVIIDCNAYWDNAGSLCSMQQADEIVLVTTNALSHFQEDTKGWYGTMSPSLGLSDKSVHALVIRQSKQYSGFTTQEIEAELQLKVIGDVLFPSSLFSSLDEGALDYWLTETSEGRNWLVGLSINLLPEQYTLKKQRAWKSVQMIWQRKMKSTLAK